MVGNTVQKETRYAKRRVQCLDGELKAAWSRVIVVQGLLESGNELRRMRISGEWLLVRRKREMLNCNLVTFCNNWN